MSLIIETGAIITGANSFVTAAELVTYAGLRGTTYPATESEQEQLLILAMDYIVSAETKYQGVRSNVSQELPFPRIGVNLYGFNVASDDIPTTLKNAQIEAALQANASDLLVNGVIQNVQSEKVDVVEVSYFSGGKWSTVQLDKVNAYLKPLMKLGGNSNLMTRV